ncbi:MAG TPA: hypothetical protein DCQ33_02115 [Nitrospira sp.]|nr:hypothetical protein [Nitrospira sp.]
MVVLLGADANAATDAALAESCVNTASTASLLRHHVVSRKTSHRSGGEAIQPRIEVPIRGADQADWVALPSAPFILMGTPDHRVKRS